MADEFDLQGFVRSFVRSWRLIAGVTLFTTLLALFFVFHSAPTFTANGTVYLAEGEDGGAPTTGQGFLSDYQVYSSVNAALQLLQSQTLVEQAILETGLNATIRPVGQSTISYWRWKFGYGKAISTFAPGPSTLAAPFAIFGDPASQGASFRIVFGQDGNYSLSVPGGWFSSTRQIGDGQWGKPSVAEGAAFILKSAVGSAPPPEGSAYDVKIIPAKVMAKQVIGALTIAASGPAVSPTNLATVAFQWPDPYIATVFVQQLMQDFIRTQQNWATESASNTESYISQQLDKISAALEAANSKEAYYQSQTGIVDVNSNSQAVINQLSSYQSQRSAILLQQEALQQLVKSLGSGAKSINPYLITQSSDSVLSGLATSLADAQVQLENDESRFGQQSPEIRHQLATIDQIQGSIGQLISNDEVIAAKNLANIDSLIAQYQNQLKSVPAETLKVGDLSRSVSVLGNLYEMLMQKEEEAEVAKAATTADTRIVDAAELPLAQTWPRPTITVLAGVVLGLVASFGYLLMQRALSGKFRAEGEIRSAMPSSIYGVVPQRLRTELRSGILAEASRSAFTESFRLLESKLAGLQLAEESGVTAQVILVTSAAEFDGKTTIAANLAKVLADGGSRVLLVDGDLECGDLPATLGLPRGPGLVEALQAGAKLQIVKSSRFNFSLLRAGQSTAGSGDVLNIAQLKGLIATLREQYDFIVFDSPPLPLASDGLILAKFADLILSVVRVDHTPRRAFAAHCELLNGTNSLHGVIINGAEVGERAVYAASKRGRNRQPGWLQRIRGVFDDLFTRLKPQRRPGA